MTVDDLMTLFRNRTEDTAVPYLWSDDEVLEYMDDAQNEACRRAHLIVDSSSNLSIGVIATGDPVVDLDYRVIAIRRARRGSDSIPLTRMGVRDMDQQVPGWEGVTATSLPQVFIPDWETGKVRLYPPPISADDLLMTVVRLPEKSVFDDNAELEISPNYHRGLLDWMLFRAYSKADPETLEEKKAKAAEAKFIAEFGEKTGAVDERWALEQYYDIGER